MSQIFLIDSFFRKVVNLFKINKHMSRLPAILEKIQPFLRLDNVEYGNFKNFENFKKN